MEVECGRVGCFVGCKERKVRVSASSRQDGCWVWSDPKQVTGLRQNSKRGKKQVEKSAVDRAQAWSRVGLISDSDEMSAGAPLASDCSSRVVELLCCKRWAVR